VISHDDSDQAGCGLRIVSFNCRSVKTSLPTVKGLCDKNDLILL